MKRNIDPMVTWGRMRMMAGCAISVSTGALVWSVYGGRWRLALAFAIACCVAHAADIYLDRPANDWRW
jgi:hypothetical protein